MPIQYIDILQPRVWHSIDHVRTIRCQFSRVDNACRLSGKISKKYYYNGIVLKESKLLGKST